jgi:hypothetical protein
MECVHRTNQSTIGIATVHAGFGNDVSHLKRASRCDSIIAFLS